MVGAGDWEALENSRRWRMEGAGDWEAFGEPEALENDRRWRVVVAATGTNFSTRLQQWPTNEL